ncbi:MAG: hypothetical protein AB1797_05405 [bacterium]
MGIAYTTIKVRNPLKDKESIEMEAKIDTEATLLVLPEEMVKDFEFPFIRRQTVKYTNEDTAERDVVGLAEVEICGRKGWFEAIVEPKKKYLLIGAVVMESLLEARSSKLEARSSKLEPRASRIEPRERDSR